MRPCAPFFPQRWLRLTLSARVVTRFLNLRLLYLTAHSPLYVARQVETEDATTNEPILFACSFFLRDSSTADYHGIPVSHCQWLSDSVSDEDSRSYSTLKFLDFDMPLTQMSMTLSLNW